MYDNNSNELNDLINNAKKQLEGQNEETNEKKVVDDIYAQFRDEEYQDEETINLNETSLENITLKQYPQNEAEFNMPNAKIDNVESVEDFEGYIRNTDEEIFPGGPTRLNIDEWKKLHPKRKIYVTEIEESFFVFRTLGRFEYKQLVAIPDLNPLQREELICQTCTLWPDIYTWQEIASEDAGIPSTYASIIMEKSGFTKDYAIQRL